MIRTYSELITLHTFEERFEYLRLNVNVGYETFGIERYLNQVFYKSEEWIAVRDAVISRDLGCDLGISDMEIHSRIIVHHMNPITIKDISEKTIYLLNPEFLITTCHSTHNAIHYGDVLSIPTLFVERKPNDTCPWKK